MTVTTWEMNDVARRGVDRLRAQRDELEERNSALMDEVQAAQALRNHELAVYMEGGPCPTCGSHGR